MATKTYTHEIYDPQGNLLSSQVIEMEVPDETPMSAFVDTLTEEQKISLLAALQA